MTSGHYSLRAAYLLLVGVLLVGVALIVLVYLPMWHGLRQMWSQKDAALQELAAKQQTLAVIDVKRAELARAQAYEQELGVILPTEERVQDMIRLLHRASETTGVIATVLTDVSLSEQQALQAKIVRNERSGVPAETTVHGLEFEVRGTYQQFRAFVEALDRAPRLLEVSSLQLERVVTTPDQLHAKMRVRFYSYGDKS